MKDEVHKKAELEKDEERRQVIMRRKQWRL